MAQENQSNPGFIDHKNSGDGFSAQTVERIPPQNPECNGVKKKKTFLYRLKRDIKKPMSWVHVLTLIVVSCYTYYAGRQTKLLLQHSVGTEAARVELIVSPSSPNGIAVTYVNRGIITAKDVSFTFTAQRMKLPELSLIEKPVKRTIFEKTVTNSDHGGPAYGGEISLPGYGQDTFQAMLATKETIKVEGNFSFNDGFENVTSIPICEYWLSYQPSKDVPGYNGFLNCEGFDVTLANVMKDRQRRNAEQKQ